MLPREKRPRGSATASSPSASAANQRHRAAGQGQKGVKPACRAPLEASWSALAA
jgi:hypothetical protein